MQYHFRAQAYSIIAAVNAGLLLISLVLAAVFGGWITALLVGLPALVVPFFLQPLIGRPDLLQADKIHPTLPGIDKLVEATVDDVAKAVPKPKG